MAARGFVWGPFLLTLTLLCLAPSWGQQPEVETNQELIDFFQQKLKRDAALWDQGNLAGFVASYAEDAVFVTSKGRVEGRGAVFERYRPRFENPENRGTLTLTVEKVRTLARDTAAQATAAGVIARWRLELVDRTEQTGWTLLVLERTPSGAWKIVQDAPF